MVAAPVLNLSLANLSLATDGPLTFSWQGWLTLGVLGAVLVVNALSLVAPAVAFLGALAVLFLSGILDETQALAGFSNPGIMAIGILYVVVGGVQQTGGLAWISQGILGLPKSLGVALVRLMVPVMGCSAFLNNTPLVAMFIPVVSGWARRLGVSPSKLLIPLSYGAIFGGTCTLMGTSTNLVVHGLLLAQTDYPPLSLFATTAIGVPCGVAGIGFIVLTQGWLLPDRGTPLALSGEDPAASLRCYTVEMVVEAQGPLVGQTISEAELRHLPGLFLAEIVRGDRVLPGISPQERLQGDDRLVFVGPVESVVDLQNIRGLHPPRDPQAPGNWPQGDRLLLEAVVSATCPLVGQTLGEAQFRDRYNAVVLAIARHGESLPGKVSHIPLRAGDLLLLEAPPAFLEQQRGSLDFYLLSPVPDSEPLRPRKAPLALGILGTMILLVGFGVLTLLQAATWAALGVLVTQCCSRSQALHSIDWNVLVVGAATLGLSQAVESTGIAATIAQLTLDRLGSDPWLCLGLVYGLTSLTTEIITNSAAAALIFPIALSLAESLQVSFLPFVITIMIGASASFATPIGYQTNLMVYGPGGYRFTDFLRLGIPLNLLFGLVTWVLVPRLYPFYP